MCSTCLIPFLSSCVFHFHSFILAAAKLDRFLDDRRLCGRVYRDVKVVSRWQELVSALLASLVCGQSEVDVALRLLQGSPVLARVFSRVILRVPLRVRLRLLVKLLLPQTDPGAKDTEHVCFLSILGFWVTADTIAFQ